MKLNKEIFSLFVSKIPNLCLSMNNYKLYDCNAYNLHYCIIVIV